ncbi:DUF1294 domain-containing protein [Roseovarius faecimaris]|uniref:DUF1294 domain-containing protein n=1 Tax=Roseovarius faecimaris TaxID=2494550 RepID=A0A6I6J440_9RHOB|nr:DUF1294 domain-containing protein [Roseovarius faecimaris]QGX99538.1 DUF1294 domain-containing protein [Roseovarius faecimaris]
MIAFLGFVFAYFCVVNAATWVLFRFDKHRARNGGRRVQERHLLTLVALGGSPAAELARRRFRHKTQKQPFARQMGRIIRIQKDVSLPALMLIAVALWQISQP